MNMQDTSLEAYDTLTRSGTKLTQKQRIIRLFLKNPHRDFTNNEISKYTGITINAVSGRVNDLRKDCELTYSVERPCSVTGVNVNAWRILE